MTDVLNIAATLSFDPDALRQKYRLERDKRIRAAGNQQYLEVDGDFSNYIDDPYSAAIESRDPLTDTVDVVIIGGGFGGLISGARLKEAGIKACSHHRKRQRLRRHLVLEPLPRRRLRYRVLCLFAAM